MRRRTLIKMSSKSVTKIGTKHQRNEFSNLFLNSLQFSILEVSIAFIWIAGNGKCTTKWLFRITKHHQNLKFQIRFTCEFQNLKAGCILHFARPKPQQWDDKEKKEKHTTTRKCATNIEVHSYDNSNYTFRFLLHFSSPQPQLWGEKEKKKNHTLSMEMCFKYRSPFP